MKKILSRIREFAGLFKETFNQWKEREPFNNSIIIAYYTIFSLPGLLVIIINIAGYFFEKESVTQNITAQIQSIVGGDSAKDVEQIVTKAQSEGDDRMSIASILSVATLLFGATGVFYQLQQILNKMWEVKPKPKQMILKLIKDRIFSFGLILVVGFLLLVSLVLSAALTAVSDWITSNVSENLIILFKGLDVILSLGVITLLFAAMYKFLPDAKIKWKDVWIGAMTTAVLFTIAKFLLGLYFGNSDPGSTYGAAGSVILIMLWVSYAGMILLFGAEFTQVYAKHHGRKIRPTEVAVSTEGQTDNGAIVNKKTEAETKAKAREKSKPPVQRRKPGEEKSKERKLSFTQLLLYLIANKFRKTFLT